MPGYPVQFLQLKFAADQLESAFTVSDGQGLSDSGQVGVMVGVSATYSDVIDTHPAYDAITSLSSVGIISSCDTGRFCPDQPLDRATLAQWLLSALEGGSYLPPFASGNIFNDVSSSDFNADWIETLATRNITEGCTADGSRYCPSDLVSRASLSALLLKTRYGSVYSPSPASGTVFDDIDTGDFHAAWIEDLWFKGITDGCDANRFCPGQPVTRAEGALWLHRAFGP